MSHDLSPNVFLLLHATGPHSPLHSGVVNRIANLIPFISSHRTSCRRHVMNVLFGISYIIWSDWHQPVLLPDLYSVGKANDIEVVFRP